MKALSNHLSGRAFLTLVAMVLFAITTFAIMGFNTNVAHADSCVNQEGFYLFGSNDQDESGYCVVKECNLYNELGDCDGYVYRYV
ncbi:MAG TPA: hypothetical protein VGO21_05550 [Candidatus Paceibacterota bacterium]|jgi:hypothetical protein|nr:hypothetical protein [Candidatus Paceibacterota bacterium]